MEPFDSLVGHNGPVLDVSIAPDSSFLISTSVDNTAIKFEMEADLSTQKEMLKFEDSMKNKPRSTDGKPSIVSVAVSDEGNWFISINKKNEACIWDTKTGEKLCSRCMVDQSKNVDSEQSEQDKLHTADVSYIVIQEVHGETIKFITSSCDNAVVQWEWIQSKTGDNKDSYIQPVTKIENAHDDDILCVEIASNNQYFVTTCYNTSIKKWDANFAPNKEEILTFVDSNISHKAPVSRCCISSDSEFMISVRYIFTTY